MRWILARSLLASCVVLFSVASYGQTPINSVPYVISAPGTYVVMQDLSYGLPTGNAITISSSNVTLDFDSHTLVCANTQKMLLVYLFLRERTSKFRMERFPGSRLESA